jgi:multidrug resistance efflux pump
MQNNTANAADIQLFEHNQIDSMLGNPPTWLMRFGVWAIAGFVSLLLLGSWLIRYPDIVEAKVVLTTERPSIRLFPKVNGLVQHLFVKQGDTIKQGQLLAVLENTANWQHVLQLETYLKNHTFTIIPNNLNVGMLQNSYANFTKNLKDYQYFMTQSEKWDKIKHLEQQIQHIQELNDQLQKQKNTQLAVFQLISKNSNRQNQLYQDGVISEFDLEKSTTAFLDKKAQIEAIETQFVQNTMQLEQNQAQMLQIQHSDSKENNAKTLVLTEDAQRLIAEIDIWKQTYLLIAPIAGKVSLSKIWAAQQTVVTTEEFLAIVPSSTTDTIIAKAEISDATSGKIKKGLPVYIRLDAFPAQEFGTLSGVIENIAAVPQHDTYSIQIALPKQLKTNYQKTIPFRPEMKGLVKIVTQERRLIEHLLDSFRNLLKNE